MNSDRLKKWLYGYNTTTSSTYANSFGDHAPGILNAMQSLESNKGESKLVCNPACIELKETQTSQLQTAATCSKSITPVVQPRYVFFMLSMLNSCCHTVA